jgi:hypothetical protein
LEQERSVSISRHGKISIYSSNARARRA